MNRKTCAKVVIWYMVAMMCILGAVPRVEAGFIPSQAVPAGQNRTDDLNRIQKVLEIKMVSETLVQYGFSEAEVKASIDGMTDSQIHQLAMNLDDARVGGDALGVVVVLLVIAILVVILLQLTGHKVLIK